MSYRNAQKTPMPQGYYGWKPTSSTYYVDPGTHIPVAQPQQSCPQLPVANREPSVQPTVHQPNMSKCEPERTSQRIYQKRENYMRRTDSFKRQKRLQEDHQLYDQPPLQVYRNRPSIFNCAADSGYMCTLSAWMKILQTLFGIVVCCCAGILCIRNTGCGSDVRVLGADWQIFVIFVASCSVITSAILYLIHICNWFSIKAFKPWELSILGLVLVLYIGAAGVESYYSGTTILPFTEQWAVAAAFAWMNCVLYAIEICYWFAYKTPEEGNIHEI